MASAFAVVIGSSAIVFISKYVSLTAIFCGMGTFAIMVGFLLIFGVKDVIRLKKQDTFLRKSQLKSA